MSYTFLQERGEVSSAESFSDIVAYVRSKTIEPAETFSSKGSATDTLNGSQSGMMLEPSTESRGGVAWMWFAVGSPAKTLAVPTTSTLGLESTDTEAVYGRNLGEWFAKWHPDTSLWKTPQCSLFEGLDEYLETWPRWGLMQGGECFQQPMLGHGTYAKGFGYLPTPRATEWEKGGLRTAEMRRDSPCLRAIFHHEIGEKMPVEFAEWIMGWPVRFTAAEPLEMDKFRQWLSSHGKH